MDKYKKFLPYCSNLDDYEYNSLWECYEEESLLKRIQNWLVGKINYLKWVVYSKIIQMRKSRR